MGKGGRWEWQQGLSIMLCYIAVLAHVYVQVHVRVYTFRISLLPLGILHVHVHSFCGSCVYTLMVPPWLTLWGLLSGVGFHYWRQLSTLGIS